MPRDIEKVIEIVRRRLPSVEVSQMEKRHPGDDDGLWWFRLSTVRKDIQIESSTGNCPFTVESNDSRQLANSVEQVANLIVTFLETQSA